MRGASLPPLAPAPFPLAPMTLDALRAHCLAKPDAAEGLPFGPDVLVFKVGGKLFALAALDALPPRVNLKCAPEEALERRERWPAVEPGRHMNKRHWVTVTLDGSVPSATLRVWVDASYDLVVAGLPRGERERVRALAAAPGGSGPEGTSGGLGSARGAASGES